MAGGPRIVSFGQAQAAVGRHIVGVPERPKGVPRVAPYSFQAMAANSDDADDGRERVARVYRYLKALNQHRSPAVRRIEEQPWCKWLSELPSHPSIRLGQFDAPPASV